jgi:CRP-like cAMP-binding protein
MDNPFLHDLTPEQYDLLSALFMSVSFPPRTVICRQGDEAVFLYVLLKGKVIIRYKPYDGPKITLTNLHTGDVFGWSSVVGNESYTSEAISTTSVQAFRVNGASLRNLCMEYPTAGRSILEKLAKAVSPRWLQSQQQIQSILNSKLLP